MPRLREVPRAEVTDERILSCYDSLFGPDRDSAVDHLPTIQGTPGDWWTVFAQDPSVFRHAISGFSLYRNAGLDPVLRELGQTRAGYARGSQFVYSQHCKSLRKLGVSEERIRAVPHWQTADCYSPLERAVLAYTDNLVHDGGRVPDEVFAILREGLSDKEILELTYITCLYDLHATMARALKLEFDDRPELITEVETPEGGVVGDLAAQLSGEH